MFASWQALFLLNLLTQTSPAVAASPRTPTAVMGCQGASWLEREGREEQQRPQEIFRVMGLKDGDVVADLGCGTGWFSRRMARAVGPHGRVYAVDIQEGMLDLLRSYALKEGVANIEAILGTDADPRLPPGGLDWILMVDVYHELQNPAAMLEAIRRSLKPSGKVALIEYRLEGSTAAHIKPPHRMSIEQVMAEWQPARFHLVKRFEFLPSQHFFVFEASP